MGRTGKKILASHAHLLNGLIRIIFKIIENTYAFVDRYIDRTLDKEHVGYIVDRVGYHAFRDEVLKDISLNDTAIVAESIQWGGYFYANDTELFYNKI